MFLSKKQCFSTKKKKPLVAPAVEQVPQLYSPAARD